jgi:hypothetical protein
MSSAISLCRSVGSHQENVTSISFIHFFFAYSTRCEMDEYAISGVIFSPYQEPPFTLQ